MFFLTLCQLLPFNNLCKLFWLSDGIPERIFNGKMILKKSADAKNIFLTWGGRTKHHNVHKVPQDETRYRKVY